MKKKDIIQNIGRFVPTPKGIVFIDETGTEWTEKNVGDVLRIFRNYVKVHHDLDHYKKQL